MRRGYEHVDLAFSPVAFSRASAPCCPVCSAFAIARTMALSHRAREVGRCPPETSGEASWRHVRARSPPGRGRPAASERWLTDQQMGGDRERGLDLPLLRRRL
jgi:hypothetical protein